MSNKHLKFIDSLPCVVCGGACGNSTHHHLLRVGREFLTVKDGEEAFLIPKVKSKGMGTKSDDKFTLPVCNKHHQEAHRYGNDKEYFKQHGINSPEQLALALFERSGQYKKAMDLLKYFFLGRRRNV